jgi:D-alanine-D-alanine ligase
VGVSIIDGPECFAEAFEEALAYDESVVVEKYIPGKEITVTVWQENDVPRALPAVEIRPKKGFYTYEAKYVPGATEYFCPAPMDEKTASAVSDAAVAAHGALGCRIYSRVDLRLSPEGHPFVLEVNTVPGMTATSLVPKAAAASGWTFVELCRRIVAASLAIAKRGALLS